MAYCEVSHKERERPKAPTALHGILGFKYQPSEKATTIPDCLGNKFIPHD
jgi:hypothetical protein